MKNENHHVKNQQITSCFPFSIKILLNQIQKLQGKPVSENLPAGASSLVRLGEGTLSLSYPLPPKQTTQCFSPRNMLLACESCSYSPFRAHARIVDYIQLNKKEVHICCKKWLKISMGQKSKQYTYRNIKSQLECKRIYWNSKFGCLLQKEFVGWVFEYLYQLTI